MDELIHDRYRVLSGFGQGGQASVLEALDTHHERKVALKISTVGDDASAEAVMAETRILLGLEPHLNLPTVRDGFRLGDQYVIVMEWIEGTDLAELLGQRGDPGLSPTLVVDVVAQAAAALDHLHAHQPPIVHGDVKPANLILTPSGRVVLVDFGIAGTGVPRRRSGTRGFAAPEIAGGGPVTPAADVYGLAASAVTLLTGQVPGSGEPVPDEIDPTVGGPMARVLRRALATDPATRPASARELAERLRAGHLAPPTGVFTFLAVEAVGTDELWDDQPDTMSAIAHRLDDVVNETVESRDGVMLGAGADEGRKLARFRQPSAAAETAIAVHEAVAREPWPAGVALTVRIALHTGEPELRDGSYTGPILNRLSRLRALTPPARTLVSALTADLIGPHLPPGAHLVDLPSARPAGPGPGDAVFALVVGEDLEPFPVQDRRSSRSNGSLREVEQLQATLEEHRTASQLARHLAGIAHRRRLAGDAGGATEVEEVAALLAATATDLGRGLDTPEDSPESARAH